jgi:zinc transport system ATP-binding protein
MKKMDISKACGQCCTKLEHIYVSSGNNRILEDINIHVHCGEFTALVGPNGAGKSTLIKVILGELSYRGKIHFMDYSKRRPNKPIIGYVPQKLDFDPTSPITVMDFFASSLSNYPLWLGYKKNIKNEATRMLSIVEANHLSNRKLGKLSGGELQRVLLALALTPPPDLLLLDEPISGMDISGIEIFYRMLADFKKQYDMSIILVSHNIAELSQYVDRIIFMNKKIISDGPPDIVLSNEKFWKTFGLNISAKEI